VTEAEKTEAESILAFAVHEALGNKNTDGSKAGAKLLRDLLALDQEVGFRFIRLGPPNDTGIKVALGARAQFLLFPDGDQILICDQAQQPIRRVGGFRYNPQTEALESTERDEGIVPTPGQPWPLRSPVALIVEAIAEETVKRHRPPAPRQSLAHINDR
jgi:hypothetical protein